MPSVLLASGAASHFSSQAINIRDLKIVQSRVKASESGLSHKFAINVDSATKDLTKASSTGIPHDAPTKDIRFGHAGRDVEIITNYVSMSKTPDYVHEYEINFGTVSRKCKSSDGDDDESNETEEGDVHKKEKGRILKALSETQLLQNTDCWATNH